MTQAKDLLASKLGRGFLLATAVLAFAHACAPVTTNDLFWHVATGEHLFAVGGFPSTDVFSYTTDGLPWVLHEWLTQLLFYAMHEVGGFPLLRLFTGVMALLILAAVYRLAKRRLGDPTAVLFVVLAYLVLGTTRIQTRPTLFSMFLFVGLVSYLTSHRGSWRWRDAAAVVVTTLLWCNLHSVGLLGPVVYLAFLAGLCGRHLLGRDDAPKRTDLVRHGVTLLASGAACCATPAGASLFAFAFQDKGSVMNFVADEWGAFHLSFADNAPLTFHAYLVILAILATVIVSYLATGIALNGISDRRRSPFLPDPVQVAMLLLCLGGGLAARRFHWMLALSLLFALMQLQRLLAGQPRVRDALRKPYLRVAALATCLVAMICHYHVDLRSADKPLHQSVLASSYFTNGIDPSLDLSGVLFMREAGLTGNAFCHYSSGGMLTFALHPKVKVFIDSRADLYQRQIVLEFLAVRDGHPDQQRILDAHGTDIFYRHWDIAALREPAGWTLAWSLGREEIWLRKTPRNRANLERCVAWSKRRDAAASPR